MRTVPVSHFFANLELANRSVQEQQARVVAVERIYLHMHAVQRHQPHSRTAMQSLLGQLDQCGARAVRAHVSIRRVRRSVARCV